MGGLGLIARNTPSPRPPLTLDHHPAAAGTYSKYYIFVMVSQYLKH